MLGCHYTQWNSEVYEKRKGAKNNDTFIQKNNENITSQNIEKIDDSENKENNGKSEQRFNNKK